MQIDYFADFDSHVLQKQADMFPRRRHIAVKRRGIAAQIDQTERPARGH
jgi:hypothetical protein